MLETLVRRRGLVRLTLAPFALIAMVGCTGLIGEGGGATGDADPGITPEEQAARDLFVNKAAPAMRAASCFSCHSIMVPMFLTGADDLAVRSTLLAYEPSVVNLDAPQSSRLVTKGAHSGPALDATNAADILEWIRAEKDAQPDPGPSDIPLETQPFTVQLCASGTPATNPTGCPINTVDLTALGVPGAKIEFVAPIVGSSLYVNQLKLTGGTNGVYIEHPLFVSHPAGAEEFPDQIDRYFATKMNLMSTDGPTQIEGGTASFQGFSPSDPITIHFKAIQAYQPDTTPPPSGGCKVLATFKTSAAPQFQNNCFSCHGGSNTNATSAMSLQGLNSADDTMVQTACNQVLTRVNLTTPDQSGIFLAPTPGNMNHDFRFPDTTTFNNFKTPILTWINAEKTAP